VISLTQPSMGFSLGREPRPMSVTQKVETDPRVVLLADELHRNLVIFSHVQSWMDHGIRLDPNQVMKLFECLECLVHLMEYSFSSILFPMLIYAERFVRMTRPLRLTEVFPLLVVSACLALKMWEDYGPDIELTAHVCKLSKKFIVELERRILATFDFRLAVSCDDIEAFQSALPVGQVR